MKPVPPIPYILGLRHASRITSQVGACVGIGSPRSTHAKANITSRNRCVHSRHSRPANLSPYFSRLRHGKTRSCPESWLLNNNLRVASQHIPPKMTQPDPVQNHPAPPAFNFEVSDGLAEWNVPSKHWLAENRNRLQERNIKLDAVTTGNLVFNPEGKVLVIQRAGHDSLPNRWEIPGGAVDPEDQTILHGAAREIWEESRLVAKRFVRLVTEGPGGRDLQIFPNSRKTLWLCRFSFIVEVESWETVHLDPAEHQAFAWVSEDEVKNQKIGERELPITNSAMQSVILESFRLRKGHE